MKMNRKGCGRKLWWSNLLEEAITTTDISVRIASLWADIWTKNFRSTKQEWVPTTQPWRLLIVWRLGISVSTSLTRDTDVLVWRIRRIYIICKRTRYGHCSLCLQRRLKCQRIVILWIKCAKYYVPKNCSPFQPYASINLPMTTVLVNFRIL
jgi:hypothetical protein